MVEFPHPKRALRRIKSHHDFMWDFFLDLLKTLFRPALIFLFFMGLLMIMAFAAAFYHFEGGHNPGVKSYFDAVYFSMSTITTVGFGDIFPQTQAGKLLSMVMMLFGTALFVSYTALISLSIMAVEGRRRREEDHGRESD